MSRRSVDGQGVRLHTSALELVVTALLVAIASVACGGRQPEPAPVALEEPIPEGVPCAVDSRWERPPETLGERPESDDSRSAYCQFTTAEGSGEGSGLQFRVEPVRAQ